MGGAFSEMIWTVCLPPI